MRMLDLKVAGMVAEVLDGDSGADEVGEIEALLDEPRRIVEDRGIRAVDDVDIFLGEEIEGSDELLRVYGREAGPGEAQRVRELRRSDCREKKKKKGNRKRHRSFHCLRSAF